MAAMKALVLHGPEDVRMETQPIPTPGPGEILLKVRAVAICGSDLGAYRHAPERFKPPLILGHEFSGDIVALGEGITKVRVGQRVSANPNLFCGECYYCKRGMTQVCAHRLSMGNNAGYAKRHGAMAEYILLPEFALIPLHDSLTYEQGAMLEPLAVCIHAAKYGGYGKGESTAVLGVGPIGLMTIMCLQALGAENIIALDMVDQRLDLALKLGAKVTVNMSRQNSREAVLAATDGIGADWVVIASGAPAAFQGAFDLVRKCGNLLLLGLTEGSLEFKPLDILGPNLTIYSSFLYNTAEFYAAMEMITSGKVDLTPIITSVVPFAQAPEAFKTLTSPNNEIKMILKM